MQAVEGREIRGSMPVKGFEDQDKEPVFDTRRECTCSRQRDVRIDTSRAKCKCGG